MESVSVMEGDSVTLHTDLTELQRDDVIYWGFEGTRIAQINKVASVISIYDDVLDGRFRDRVHLDSQTGDLTISDVIAKDSGLYKLQISDSSKSIEKIFNVTGVIDVDREGVKSVSVIEADSVTLYTDVPDFKKYDVILWRFQHENSPLAELNRTAGILSVHDDGRFRDGLKLDNQTGSLTIRNIRSNNSGLYEVDINSSRRHTIHQTFRVTVSGGVKSVSVNEGDSVTLYTDTEIQTYDFIEWMFGDERTQIAQMYKPDARFVTYDGDDGRFRDKLKLNDQTGSLTITNIRTEHKGVYEVKISSNRHSLHRRFIVIVTALGLSSVTVVICILFLLVAGVTAAVIYYRWRSHRRVKFYDKEMDVLEGGSVTLHTSLTHVQIDDVIEWRFGHEKVTIAKITNATSKCVDERFKDKLTLDPQTGDLTINNISNEQSGFYQLNIIKRKKLSSKKFNVIVIGELMTVNAGESVTLETRVTEIQRDDKIEWMFGDKETVIAQTDSAFNIFSTYDGDNDVFKDTLGLDHQTGDLTIKNIRKRHAGVYTLKIIISGNVSFRRLRVTVTDITANDLNESLNSNVPLMNSASSGASSVT
nr:uncharacterized protein LOC129453500 [Misgurnus anguillicaudatus]